MPIPPDVSGTCTRIMSNSSSNRAIRNLPIACMSCAHLRLRSPILNVMASQNVIHVCTMIVAHSLWTLKTPRSCTPPQPTNWFPRNLSLLRTLNTSRPHPTQPAKRHPTWTPWTWPYAHPLALSTFKATLLIFLCSVSLCCPLFSTAPIVDSPAIYCICPPQHFASENRHN